MQLQSSMFCLEIDAINYSMYPLGLMLIDCERSSLILHGSHQQQGENGAQREACGDGKGDHWAALIPAHMHATRHSQCSCATRSWLGAIRALAAKSFTQLMSSKCKVTVYL